MTRHWVKVAFLVILVLLLFSQVSFGCVPSTPSAPAAPTAPATAKKIIIRYSSTVTDQVGEWSEADPGYTYLILDLDIENQGYDSFSTNPFYFYVVVSNVKCSSAFVIGLEDELKVVDLLRGGKASGTLAFEVPTEVSSAGYQIGYEAFEKYNIEWIKR